MTEAERVAASLTEAMKRMVLASAPDDITGEEGCGVEIRGSGYRVARSLGALGLGSHTHGSPICDMYWSNPFGLAVRAILRTKESDK